jgi:ABC-type nitrate/sulfonate/bicarbonate transport system substrate-binding protein
MSKPIRVGLLRLVDSAPVILAQANGLFSAQGIDVQISIEPSWSNVADKLTYGVLDAAVMLPPLALAACAGLRGPKARLVVPMSLSQGGNAIVAGNQAATSLTEDGSQWSTLFPRTICCCDIGWRLAGLTRIGISKLS